MGLEASICQAVVDMLIIILQSAGDLVYPQVFTLTQQLPFYFNAQFKNYLDNNPKMIYRDRIIQRFFKSFELCKV